MLVCDGAMGTMLYGKGIFLNRCFDELNLTQPDLVAEVHQAYVRAGADVIETNTFGANRMKLGAFGLAERTHAINLQGARIARHAARDELYVAGAIGPLAYASSRGERRASMKRSRTSANKPRRWSKGEWISRSRDIPRREMKSAPRSARCEASATCRSSRR